jgi:hypothetical protein
MSGLCLWNSDKKVGPGMSSLGAELVRPESLESG